MDKTPWSHPHQKLGLVVVVVIGLTTLIFGVISLRKAVFDPFVRRSTGITFKSSEQLEQERMEALKNKDTDSDGLVDYDELYIYRTSPFLEDSDSDGENDGSEVKSGTDPNCPKNRICRQPRTTQVAGGDQPVGTPDDAADQPADIPDDAVDQPATPVIEQDSQTAAMIRLFTETFGPPETLTPEIITAKLDAMSSAELRAFFVKMGIPSSAVEKADDATLRQVFLETIKDLEAQAGTSPAGAGTSGTPPDETP